MLVHTFLPIRSCAYTLVELCQEQRMKARTGGMHMHMYTHTSTCPASVRLMHTLGPLYYPCPFTHQAPLVPLDSQNVSSRVEV